MAGLEPAGVICEVMNPDGTMARRPGGDIRARAWVGYYLCGRPDSYRLLKETMVQAVAEVEVDIEDIGRFKVITYQTEVDGLEHLAIVKGQPLEDEPTLGRVQQENVLSDVFRCSAPRWNLEFALREMEKAGCGVLVYLQKPAPRLENEVRGLSGGHRSALPSSAVRSDCKKICANTELVRRSYSTVVYEN